MLKKIIFLLSLCFLTLPVYGEETPTALSILEKVDQNYSLTTQISVSSMIIHSRRGTRTIKAKTWTRGRTHSFTEYLSPKREKGTKMLKVDQKLWTFYPRTDRIISISGHMLRQPLMGTDLSYEDLMENNRMSEIYEAIIEKKQEFNNRQTWVLKLQAKRPDIAYQSRRIWVDQERYLPLKEELYGVSGKLLKTIEIQEVFQTEKGWYPKQMLFKDVLKKGKGTQMIIHEVEFDKKIPNSRFSKRSLRK